MNDILNTTTFIVLAFLVLGGSFRYFKQPNALNKITFFSFLFVLSLNSALVGEFGYLSKLFSINLSLIILKISLCLMGFSSLAIIAVVITKFIEDKKIKTLWRLPVIGVLIGSYLNPLQCLTLFVGVEVIATILVYRFSSEYRYIYRQQLKALFAMPLVLLLSDSNIWVLNICAFFYILMKFQIINAFKLKLEILKYRDLEKNNKEA